MQFDPDVLNQGPRLGDLHVQTSSYGGAIPIIWGTVRVAGNVIWKSEIRETAIDEEQGKGGPTTTNREFAYDVDVAIAFSSKEVISIEKIYANGVLIYDTAVGASPATVFANGQWATSTYLYPGSETQLPDPIIEAAVGVGNTQAYRGTAYLVIGGLQLTVLKTQVIPNFEFVVVQSGTLTQYQRLAATDALPLGVPPTITMDNGIVRVGNFSTDEVLLFDLDANPIGIDAANDFEESRPPYSSGSEWGFWTMFDGTAAVINLSVGIVPRDLRVGTAPTALTVSGIGTESPPQNFLSFTQCAGNRYIIATLCDTASVSQYAEEWIRFEWDGDALIVDDRGPCDPNMDFAGFTGLPTAGFNHYGSSFGESDLRTIWTAYGAGNGNVAIRQIDDTGTLVELFDFYPTLNTLFDHMGGFTRTAIYADHGLAWVAGDDALLVYTRLANVASSGPTLNTVVSDLCTLAGITSGERTTSALTQIVRGFVIGQTMTARAAIEALRPAFFFDAVNGDTLKFVNRGGSSAVTFDVDDLGAGEGDAAPMLVDTQLAQERELPSRFNVSYISESADYQIGAQSARRETSNSREITTAQIPVVLTDTEAAQVADINLRDQWAGAAVRRFTTGLAYSKDEPTDVVSVDDGVVIRTVRLTKRTDRPAMIEWEARDEDAETYTSNAVGVTITVPEQTLELPGPTDVEVLDLPPLTELPSGNEAAAYIAGRGLLSGWSSAIVEISRDGGSAYTSGTVISTAAVMGTATTALADFAGGNVFDECSVARVNVGSATLSSATRAAVLNGANPAVVGDEIIQFRTATLVSTGVYDLTGLLARARVLNGQCRRMRLMNVSCCWKRQRFAICRCRWQTAPRLNCLFVQRQRARSSATRRLKASRRSLRA